MSGVIRESATQFQVRFGAGGGRLRRLFGATEPGPLDPYRVGQALIEVMRRCDVRAASGARLLWNEYRLIVAREQFEELRVLEGYLYRDLEAVLRAEAQRLDAAMVGELCVHIVADEGRELEAGRGVVRVGFAPTEKLAAPEAGEMTVRLGAVAVSGVVDTTGGARRPDATVPVGDGDDPAVRDLVSTYRLRWTGGEGNLLVGVRTVIGRPHPGHPPQFIPLRGASARINKQQLWIVAMHARAVVGRMPGANPVHVGDRPIGAGEELEIAASPATLSLSRGELVLTLERLAEAAGSAGG
jgi:hypothetical protein